MFFMYILKSSKDGKCYIGSTSDLKKRIKEHDAGLVRATKYRRPLGLVYCEGYVVEEEARHREHNLKLRARALRQLLLRIKDPLAS